MKKQFEVNWSIAGAIYITAETEEETRNIIENLTDKLK